MGIAEYALVISGLALVVAALSLWLHYVQHRQRTKNQEPQVKCTLWLDKRRPGWCTLQVMARNRSDTDLRLVSVTVLKPRHLVIARDKDAVDYSRPNEPKPIVPTEFGRSAVGSMLIRHKGTAPSEFRRGEENLEYFYLSFLAARPASSDHRRLRARWNSSSQSSAKLLILFEADSASASELRISQTINVAIPAVQHASSTDRKVQN